jgi:hypothetical protein
VISPEINSIFLHKDLDFKRSMFYSAIGFMSRSIIFTQGDAMQKFLSILLLFTVPLYTQAMEKSIPQPDDWEIEMIRGRGVVRSIPQPENGPAIAAIDYAQFACAQERRLLEEYLLKQPVPAWAIERELKKFDEKCETEFQVASVLDQMTKAMNEGLAAGGSQKDYQEALAKVGVKPEDVKIDDSDSQNPKE